MRGLVNVGNTCGLNTLIQCIGHIPVLREWVLHANEETQQGLSKELAEILVLQWKEQKTVIPRKFMHAFAEALPMFPIGEQHDLCELWTMMVDKIGQEHHTDAHLNKNARVITIGDPVYDRLTKKAVQDMLAYNKQCACEWTDLIQGVQVSQLKCVACENILHNIEPWMTIPVHLHDHINVAQCIESYMQTTMVEDWKCEKCAESRGEQIARFWKLPSVLVVTLKRFSYDMKYNEMKKQSQPIHVPECMEFAPAHVIGPEARIHMSTHQQKMRYRLWSMGLHHGDAANGHYTAVGRIQENEWVHYNDAHVQKIENINDFLTNNSAVYMLFYMLDADAH